MSFLRAARAARVGQSGLRRMPAALAVIIILALAGICISCSNTTKSAQQPLRNAYVTLPATGSVLLLQVNETTGEIALEARTPPVEGDTPTGLALHPSKKFLYVVNSVADTISTFNIAIDGTLSFNGVTTPTGNGPHTAVVDPSGNYLLVSNLYGSNGDDGDISVYSIDASSGVLTEVAGSPFSANQYPTAISFTHSGKFLYVTNPGIGMVSSFSFADGVLTQLSNSPVYSGAGGLRAGRQCQRQCSLRCQPFGNEPSALCHHRRQHLRVQHRLHDW